MLQISAWSVEGEGVGLICVRITQIKPTCVRITETVAAQKNSPHGPSWPKRLI